MSEPQGIDRLVGQPDDYEIEEPDEESEDEDD